MTDLNPIPLLQDDDGGTRDVVREAGLRSDGELVQAVSEATDTFEFYSGGSVQEGGFSEVSGLSAEVTLSEYREGAAHTPEWTNFNDGDPGGTPVSSDPEWRYLPVRRFADDGEEDVGFHWGEDGLL